MEEPEKSRKTEIDEANNAQKRLTVTPPTVPRITAPRLGLDRHKIKYLAAALLLIVSMAAGFLGGWLGANSKDNNSSTSTVAQKDVVFSQDQLISNIAKTVSPSVVSVN